MDPRETESGVVDCI